MFIMINNNFSILLAKKLLKITQVANDTGLSRTTLTNLYYRRTNLISLDVLDKLCRYLDCNVGDILNYEEGWNG